jgi:hypothetical protein
LTTRFAKQNNKMGAQDARPPYGATFRRIAKSDSLPPEPIRKAGALLWCFGFLRFQGVGSRSSDSERREAAGSRPVLRSKTL